MSSGDDPNRDLDPARDATLVHEARKAVKRMRALARLLREEIGEEEFHRVNWLLRDAGRRLAASRDAEVRLATLRRLINRHPKALALDGVARLTETLERERSQASAPAQGASSQRSVLEDVAGMRRELSRWNLVDQDFGALAPGLRRIYSEGRRRYTRAKRKGARPEELHEWRKRVKALYYALDMLGAARAKGTRRLTERAERLGEVLGEEHDLSMLAEYVEAHPRALGEDERSRAVVLKLVGRRRKRLLERALFAGARLYGDSPRELTRRVGNALYR